MPDSMSRASLRVPSAGPPPQSTVVKPCSIKSAICSFSIGPAAMCLCPSRKPGSAVMPLASITVPTRCVAAPAATEKILPPRMTIEPLPMIGPSPTMIRALIIVASCARAVPATDETRPNTNIQRNGFVVGPFDMSHPLTVNPLQQGGISEKDKCVVRNVGRFDADRERCGGATGPIQRDRGDDGSLAHRVKGCGSEQKTLPCHGRQIDARGKPTDHVSRRLDQSGTRNRERKWPYSGFGGEPCRFHRGQRPEAGRAVEGCGRERAPGRQQPVGPSLRRDARRRSYRNPGRQDPVDADPQ